MTARMMALLTVCFLLFTHGAMAARKINLEPLHGKDLKKADFVLRYKFAKMTHMAWEKSTYEQRKAFLERWYQNEEKQARLEELKRRESLRVARQLRDQERAKQQQERRSIAAKRAAELRESRGKVAQQKQFEDAVDSRNKQIADLRRKQRKD